MLDQFKNPPAQYRTIEFDNTADSPQILIRELKMEFDRRAAGIDTLPFMRLPKAIRSDSPYFRFYIDYAARVRYALSHGQRRAQVALLMPSMGSSSDFFEFYNANLPLEHVSHDVIDEDAIISATSVDQSLICPSNRYEMLILPPIDAVRYETALKIQEFVDDGGRVMATMPIPTKDSHGKKDSEVRSIFHEIFGAGSGKNGPVIELDNGAILVQTQEPSELAPTLRDCISMAIKPDVSITSAGRQCREITFVHHIYEDNDIFFFANSSPDAREVQLSIRCDKAPHILDPETGEQIALINCTQQGSRTILLHRFEGCGSLTLCFDYEPSLTVPTPQFEHGRQIILSGEWSTTSDNTGAALYSQKTLIPEFMRSQRVIAKLEDSPDIVEFIINGASAGARLWPPYEMDITALVKPGPNEVTLKVISSPSIPLGRAEINIY
ncbi:MAG: glycosyl hydrolase [Armatimonadota bacterium]